MSSKIKLETFRKYIREIIKQHLEELEEASVTGNIDGGEGPPKTPFAFSGKRKKDKKKEKQIATNSTGFEVVKESIKEIKVKREHLQKLVNTYGTKKVKEALTEYWWDDLSDEEKDDYIDKHGEAPKRRGSTKDKAKSPEKKLPKSKEYPSKKDLDKDWLKIDDNEWVRNDDDDPEDPITFKKMPDGQMVVSKEVEPDYRPGGKAAPDFIKGYSVEPGPDKWPKGHPKHKPEKKKQEPEKKSIMTGKGRKKKPNPKKWEDVKAGDVYKLKSGELMHVINYGDNHIQTIIHPNPEHTSVSGGKKRKRTMNFAKPGKPLYKPGFDPKTATVKQRIRNRINPMPFNSIDKSTGKSETKENVNEGRYHDYRNDDTLSPKQKIGRSMREVRDSLRNLEKVVGMNVRLKNELNVDSRSYWKNTHKALGKIGERLVKLANKVGEMK